MSGLWLPPGTATPGSIAAAELVPEVEKIVEWVKRWPREGEPPISVAEVAKLVVTRAQMYLWDRHKCETILKLVTSALELPAPGDAVKGRKGLKPVCNHEWANPGEKFLKCALCGYMTVRISEVFDIASTPAPSRITQTDSEGLKRNSSRVPKVDTRKLKEKLPS
jgi:hypothetical protein